MREVPLIDGHSDVPWQYCKRGNDSSATHLATDAGKFNRPLTTYITRLRKRALAINSSLFTYLPIFNVENELAPTRAGL